MTESLYSLVDNLQFVYLASFLSNSNIFTLVKFTLLACLALGSGVNKQISLKSNKIIFNIYFMNLKDRIDLPSKPTSFAAARKNFDITKRSSLQQKWWRNWLLAVPDRNLVKLLLLWHSSIAGTLSYTAGTLSYTAPARTLTHYTARTLTQRARLHSTGGTFVKRVIR